MKVVRLFGYYFNNFGDDLMTDILLKRYPDVLFYHDSYYSSDLSARFADYPNFINRLSLERKYGRLNHLLNVLTRSTKKDFFLDYMRKAYIKRCTCSVHIGGSIYKLGINERIEDRIIIEKEKLSVSPLFIIGANIEKSSSAAYVNSLTDFFSLVGGVCFRDKYSFNTFSHLKNVGYAPDVVFNYPFTKRKNVGKVLVSVINFDYGNRPKEYKARYEELIQSICLKVIEEGKKPTLVSLCDVEEDNIAVKRIYQSFPDDVRGNIDVHYYDSIPKTVELFESADAVLATRFHSLVLSIAMSIPFYCIAYDNKCINLMQDLDMDNYCTLQDIYGIECSDIHFTEIKQKTKVKDYIHNAGNQFEHFERYIQSGN